MRCPDGHAAPDDCHFCPACGVAMRCPNGHEVVLGVLSCPDCGQAYATPNVSKATEIAALAAKAGGGFSGLPANPVPKPTGRADISDEMASESKLTKCPMCLVLFSSNFEEHSSICSTVNVTCPNCDRVFGRDMLMKHVRHCTGPSLSVTPGYGTVSLRDVGDNYRPPPKAYTIVGVVVGVFKVLSFLWLVAGVIAIVQTVSYWDSNYGQAPPGAAGVIAGIIGGAIVLASSSAFFAYLLEMLRELVYNSRNKLTGT
jgi:hypothetical protein